MLCTSPLHQRTGAARLFLQHLAAQADAEGLEIYLDATKGESLTCSPARFGAGLAHLTLTSARVVRVEGLPVYPRFGYELVQGFEPIVACDGSFSVSSALAGRWTCGRELIFPRTAQVHPMVRKPGNV